MIAPVNEVILFVDVVKEKSFSKAAAKNSLTPAAVSKRISHLEDILGVKLLTRSTRALSLTDAGSILFERASNIHQRLDYAIAEVLESHDSISGAISISAPTNFCNLLLAPLLVSFSKQYPDISFNVTLNDKRGISTAGDYDLMICAGKTQDSCQFFKLLYELKFVICATPSYFEQHPKPVIAEDITQHNCIDYSYREERNYWIIYHENDLIKIPVSGKIRTNNALFIKNVVMNGGGLACLPDFMVGSEIEQGKLVSVLDNYGLKKMPVNIVFPHKIKELPKKIVLFMDFLLKAFREKTPSEIREMIA